MKTLFTERCTGFTKDRCVPPWYTFLALLGLIAGCGASPPADESDESIAIDEQIGQTEQAVTQAQKDWWKNLAQWSRDTWILLMAYADNNKYVGLNCKEWARKIVLSASNGVVNLPSTTQSGSGWTWYSSPYVQQMGSISSAAAGNIVQMNLGAGNPHTAIVWSNDGSNICWIDSNYLSALSVGIHCQTVTQFLNRVSFGGFPHYTVYQITGG